MRMATERVTLTMDPATVSAAKAAAAAAGVSLSAWIDKAALDRAIEIAARASAAQDRLHRGELADWDTASADRVFGDME